MLKANKSESYPQTCINGRIAFLRGNKDIQCKICGFLKSHKLNYGSYLLCKCKDPNDESK